MPEIDGRDLMARVVFMGTPAFAVGSLQVLIDAGHELLAVVTQPDKPAGRGQRIRQSPIKQLALTHGIPVLQPGRLRKEPDSVQRLRDLAPDVMVVVAFGQILPQEVLDIPPKGCLNVHGSLLPAYRGAGPIQWALINGETETGVTTMLMDAGMDTGPMLLVTRMAILPDDDAASLGVRMADVGAKLLGETLAGWLEGTITTRPQPTEGISMAPMLKKEQGVLDWQASARRLHDRVRGTTPWPGAQTAFEGQPFKIVKTAPGPAEVPGAPGAIVEIGQEGWLIATGSGGLWLQTVQWPGKRPQSGAEAARGLRSLGPGVVLGA